MHPFSSGCLIRVVNTTKPDPANPGSNLFTKVTESLAVSNTDVDKSEDLVFIVPRCVDPSNIS